MNTVALSVEPRTTFGKKGAKADRNSGLIPCVMYGGNEPKHFTTRYNDIKGLIYTPDFKVAEVNLEGAAQRAIVKSVDFHPVTEEIMHIDFLALIPNQSVKVEIPVRFKGTSPGVRSGGKLMQTMRRVKIKTTPEALVDELLADISSLELGHAIRVRDLEVGDGIEIMTSGATPIATVEVPRALRSAATAAAKESKTDDA